MEILSTLRTRKQLYGFYYPEINRRSLRYWLNEIVTEHRPRTSKHICNLTLTEFLIFIARYGIPQGCELSMYIRDKIKKRNIDQQINRATPIPTNSGQFRPSTLSAISYLPQKCQSAMDNLINQQINQGLYRPLQAGTLCALYIPASDCSSKLLGRGDTSLIITNMAATARKHQHHTKLLTLRFFSYKSLYSLCNTLHQFLFWHFQCAIDGDAQMLRSPACGWAPRYSDIDCKGYTIFGSTVLLNLGIKHHMRRIVQPSHPGSYAHAYLVIPRNQKTANLNSGYYVIDGIINTGRELPYLEKDSVLTSSSANQSIGKILSAPAQPTLTDVMNASYTASAQIAQLTHEQIVAQCTQVTNLVGTILASLAEVTGIFFPPALIAGVAIEAVTAIVSLAFLILSNLCGVTFYKADHINQHLEDEFYPQFNQRIQYL